MKQPQVVASASRATCVACESDALDTYLHTRNFTLVRCGVCGTLTGWPRPSQPALTSHHDTEVYHQHPYFERRRTDLAAAGARWAGLAARVGSAVPGFSARGARHLDVGCDTGTLLEAAAAQHGTVSVGLDVAARAVARARARGLDVRQGTLEEAVGLGEFDLITLVDVLEHVSDPRSFLRAACAHLRPGGACYVETPDVDSLVYRLGRAIATTTGGHPAWICERLFLPEHVQYFSVAGLQRVAESAGLRLRHINGRALSSAEINTVAPVRGAVHVLQLLDRIRGRHILHCAVLTR